jgi:hypothetical protein
MIKKDTYIKIDKDLYDNIYIVNEDFDYDDMIKKAIKHKFVSVGFYLQFHGYISKIEYTII